MLRHGEGSGWNGRRGEAASGADSKTIALHCTGGKDRGGDAHMALLEYRDTCAPSLVRFYLAIENGLAQEERDLGVLTGEEAAYKGGGGLV